MNPETYQLYLNRSDDHVRIRVYMDGSTVEDKCFPSWEAAYCFCGEVLQRALELTEEYGGYTYSMKGDSCRKLAKLGLMEEYHRAASNNRASAFLEHYNIPFTFHGRNEPDVQESTL